MSWPASACPEQSIFKVLMFCHMKFSMRIPSTFLNRRTMWHLMSPTTAKSSEGLHHQWQCRKHSGDMFFLNAPDENRKIIVTTLSLAHARQKNMVAIAVTSSDIAAILLPGCQATYLTFKLPLNFVVI